MINLVFWAALLVAGNVICAAQDKVEFKTIDGIPHVLNPARPLKGTIELEFEPVLTIDPYERPEVGIKILRFCRGEDGRLILYSGNQVEAHLHSADGSYLGSLGKRGQGPGEFSQAFIPAFFDRFIYAFTTTKMIRFDREGRFINEVRLAERPSWIVREDRYLNVKQEARGSDWEAVLQLVTFNPERSGEDNATELLRGKSLGAIKRPGSSERFVGERWGTPNFVSTSDPLEKRIYTGFNTEYKIGVRDEAGKVLFVIERPYQKVRISNKDVEFLFRSQFEAYGFRADDPTFHWIQKAFPNHLVAVRALFPLPKGYLAAYRTTKPMEFEIDIFDRDGRYLYALIPPHSVPMFNIQYHRGGFSVIEPRDDLFVYREYRIKNLPEVFGK